MTRKEQNKILDDKIKANKRQYDLDRTNAEVSAYSSGDLPKYEYLTKNDLGYKPNSIEQTKFEYSPLGRILNQGLDKSDKNKGILKRLKDIENKSNNQLLAIRDINRLAIKDRVDDDNDDDDDDDDDDDELYKEIFNNYKNNIIDYKGIKDNLNIINKIINIYKKGEEILNNNIYKKGEEILKNNPLLKNQADKDKNDAKVLKRIINEILSNKIIKKNTTKKVIDITWMNDPILFHKINKDVTNRYRKDKKSLELSYIQSFLDDINNEGIENKKDAFKDLKDLKNNVKSDELKDIAKELERAIFGYDGENKESSSFGLKILTKQQMLSRLPILLAQIQAGNNSTKLKNEIRQILYLLYRSKK